MRELTYSGMSTNMIALKLQEIIEGKEFELK